MFLLLHVDNLGRAVRVTRVIQIASLVSMEGRINDILFVETEKVTITYALLLINNLTFISNFVSYFFTYVFYHNFVCRKILMSKEPIPMDLARTNFNTLRLCLT